jgi:hypothetical protein
LETITSIEARNETRIAYLEQSIDKILHNIDQLNQQWVKSTQHKPFNWPGMGMLFLTILLCFGGAGSGLLSYIDYRDTAIAEEMDEKYAYLNASILKVEEGDTIALKEQRDRFNERFDLIEAFRTQTHYEIGVFQTTLPAHEKRMDELADRITRNTLDKK